MDPSTDVDDSPPKKVATSILIFDDKIYRSIIQASFSLISTKLTETSKTKKKKKKRKAKERKRNEKEWRIAVVFIRSGLSKHLRGLKMIGIVGDVADCCGVC